MKNDNYHLGQLNRPVSQIDIQRNMVGFVMEGHNYYKYSKQYKLMYWKIAMVDIFSLL